MLPLLALPLLAAPLLPQTPAQPPLETRLAALVHELEQAAVATHAPGFALAVVLDDQVVLTHGYGLADVDAKRPVTPETIFAIGSTTKAFTATLLTELASEHGFALEDPVVEHLAWFDPPVTGTGKATLVDLLAHRTGFVRMDVLWAGNKASRTEVLKTALGAEPIAKRGEAFLYNNVMYLAAGEVCAAVGGASWEEQVTQRFFVPLGMTSTTLSVAAAQKDPRLALGYHFDADKGAFEHDPMRSLDAIAPAGAINSNVLDLTRWLRCQLAGGELDGKRIVRAESIERTWKKENRMNGSSDYGLGWMLASWRGERAIWHGGNIDGFTAALWMLPSRKAALALLVNATGSPLAGTVGPLAFDALFPAPAAASTATAAAPSEDLTRYTGSYVANYFTFHDARFVVSAADGVLAIDVPGQTNFALRPPDAQGLRPFALVPNEIQASFEERDGQIVALRLHQGGLMFECPREGYVAPLELEPQDYEPLLGRFADPLTKKTFEVRLEQGRLACDYPGQMAYGMNPPDDQERWVFRATPSMALEFVLDADGRAEAVVFHERGTQRTCERVEDGPALPTVDALMALRKVDEFERRLAELAPCRWTSALRLVNCGMRGTVTLTFDAGTRFRDHTDLSPYIVSDTISEDTTTKTRTSLAEKELVLTGKNHEQALLSHPATLFGDWRKRFDRVEVLRAETKGASTVVSVRLVKGSAPALEVDLDGTTGALLVVRVQELVDGAATTPKTMTIEGWQAREGLLLPTRIVTEDQTNGRIVAETTAFEAHVELR